jgi:hypothetical protein
MSHFLDMRGDASTGVVVDVSPRTTGVTVLFDGRSTHISDRG